MTDSAPSVFNQYVFFSFFSFMYFSLVASPPLMCLSALFSIKTAAASSASLGFICLKRSVISLCTVVVKMILFVKTYVGQKF